jgi:hypothetical protein
LWGCLAHSMPTLLCKPFGRGHCLCTIQRHVLLLGQCQVNSAAPSHRVWAWQVSGVGALRRVVRHFSRSWSNRYRTRNMLSTPDPMTLHIFCTPLPTSDEFPPGEKTTRIGTITLYIRRYARMCPPVAVAAWTTYTCMQCDEIHSVMILSYVMHSFTLVFTPISVFDNHFKFSKFLIYVYV